MNAVPVSMNHVTGVDLEAPDFNRFPKIDNMRVGVRYSDASRKQVKSGFLHRRQVSDGAVGYAAYAAERKTDVCMDLAYECPDSRLVVNVLQYHDSRFWNGENILPPVHAIVIAPAGHWRRRRAGSRRGRVAQHRLKVRELAVYAPMHETLVAKAHVKPLYGVRYGTGIQVTDLFEFAGGQHTFQSHHGEWSGRRFSQDLGIMPVRPTTPGPRENDHAVQFLVLIGLHHYIIAVMPDDIVP